MKKKDTAGNLFLYLIIISFSFYIAGQSFAQEKKKVPDEQTPVEERDTGDSLIENIGELPGKIITFPFILLFKGVSKTSRVVDFGGVVLRVTDWLTNEDGTRKVRPIFTPISGGGLVFVQDNFLKNGMRLRASGTYAKRTRTLAYAGLRHPQLFSSKFGLQVEGFYQRQPDEDFFGIGNHSLNNNETNYLHEEYNFEIAILSSPFKKVIVSTGFSYSDVKIKDGRDSRTPSLITDATKYDEAIPGLFGAQMATFLFKIYRDTRNRTGNPTKGGEEFFSYEQSMEIAGSELGYIKYTIDLWRYIHLFYNRVLALRLRTEFTNDLGDRHIPFYRLGSLGGREVFRGHRLGRFREKDLFVAGAEYRFPIHSMMDAFAFFEEGRVFEDIFEEFNLKQFKYAVGGGLRIRSRDGNLVALIEIAKSREQLKFYFSLNKGFRKF